MYSYGYPTSESRKIKPESETTTIIITQLRTEIKANFYQHAKNMKNWHMPNVKTACMKFNGFLVKVSVIT